MKVSYEKDRKRDLNRESRLTSDSLKTDLEEKIRRSRSDRCIKQIKQLNKEFGANGFTFAYD
jgi:hypothetical protein